MKPPPSSEPPAPRRSLLLRAARALVLTIAVLGTATALFYAFENWRGDHAWAAVLAQLSAKGERLTMPELLGAAPPDDQNFAATPLFAGLFEPPSTNSSSPQRKAFERLGDYQLPDLPTKGATNDGHGNLAEMAAQMRASNAKHTASKRPSGPLYPVPAIPGSPAEDVLAGLAPMGPGLAELSSALRRPASRFPVRWEENFGALLPHLAHLKRLEVAWSLRAMAFLEKGDMPAAFADVTDGFRLAEALGGEPCLISQLVRLALTSIAMRPLQAGLAAHRWNDAQLAAFQAQLAPLTYLPGIVLAFEGERCLQRGGAEELVAHPEMIERVASPSPDGPGSSHLEALLRFGPHGWIRQNEAASVRLISLEVDALRAAQRQTGPARYALVTGTAAWPGDDLTSQPAGLYTYFAKMWRPAGHQPLVKAARAEVTIAMAVTVCALERHYLAHGAYPASLTDLNPALLPRPATDPLNGQPLHYALLPDGAFRLYSVGPNLKDDGGEYFRKGTGDLDWPWPAAHPTGRPTLF